MRVQGTIHTTSGSVPVTVVVEAGRIAVKSRTVEVGDWQTPDVRITTEGDHLILHAEGETLRLDVGDRYKLLDVFHGRMPEGEGYGVADRVRAASDYDAARMRTVGWIGAAVVAGLVAVFVAVQLFSDDPVPSQVFVASSPTPSTSTPAATSPPTVPTTQLSHTDQDLWEYAVAPMGGFIDQWNEISQLPLAEFQVECEVRDGFAEIFLFTIPNWQSSPLRTNVEGFYEDLDAMFRYCSAGLWESAREAAARGDVWADRIDSLCPEVWTTAQCEARG